MKYLDDIKVTNEPIEYYWLSHNITLCESCILLKIEMIFDPRNSYDSETREVYFKLGINETSCLQLQVHRHYLAQPVFE